MIVQQERTKPRQLAGTDPKENVRAATNGGTSEDEGHSRNGDEFRTGHMRNALLRKDPGKLLLKVSKHTDKKKGNACDYLSDNLPKVVIVGLLFLSALILIVVRNRGDSAALLCIESVSKQAESIPFPEVEFGKISKLIDAGKYGIVKSRKWIVVVASGPPTEEIRALVKLPGWKVVVVGNSETPSDWDVKGAIFLSVDQQAAFGYRILAHLPYDSYVRKTVGYLFAIQHGAKVIYDADENASVLGEDLGTVFDLELTGMNSRKEPLLQYIPTHNRTCINPYIHFGQRSVWPRGFPLEFVNEINPDIYYGQTFSGNQYIQQGLADGFPDVDSIFYHTRKSGIESFDIHFDPHAPAVALPQGLFAPVNNLNTLFHFPAFWALMLPVSVSSKASDIIRGYWAQRLLWEIGGCVAIYPPSIHRIDNMQLLSFEDEKDLHGSSGKLAKMLVSWRSNKSTVFNKILHLSHSMAEAGFWSAKDVIYTAAWLQDLISVGYIQPRLAALELDIGSLSLPHADHQEFVPLRLPSVHLGVDEATSVSSEVGNLLRWRKFYGNVVLILHCSWPTNHTALGWKMLYGRIFKSVVVLSEETDLDLGVEKADWWQVYKALPNIFGAYSNAEGFLFMKDDVILNYWNLLQANKSRLWNLHKVHQSWKVVAYNETGSEWYLKSSMKRYIRKMLSSLPVHFQITYRENMDEDHFAVCSSDAFYVPYRFVGDFIELVNLGSVANLHQEVAIPLFFLAMESMENFDTEAFSNVQYRTEIVFNPAAFYLVEAHAVHPWMVTSELDLLNVMKAMSSGDPLLLEVF
eukprot:c21875_g1_i1 orf=563-2974(+)